MDYSLSDKKSQPRSFVCCVERSPRIANLLSTESLVPIANPVNRYLSNTPLPSAHCIRYRFRPLSSNEPIDSLFHFLAVPIDFRLQVLMCRLSCQLGLREVAECCLHRSSRFTQGSGRLGETVPYLDRAVEICTQRESQLELVTSLRTSPS